jgi:hypothetical protein
VISQKPMCGGLTPTCRKSTNLRGQYQNFLGKKRIWTHRSEKES